MLIKKPQALAHDPVIVASFRTPLGKYGGILSNIRPDDMMAYLLACVVQKLKLDPKNIDEVIIGCANQAGEDNRNIARMAVLLSGLPTSIPAITVNRLCASGLDAIIDGARRIITGEANLVLSGGVESMSRAPYVLAKQNGFSKPGAPPVFDTALGWRFFNEAMHNLTPPEANGVTAERLAKEYDISRQSQDEFALRSHNLAISSSKNGFFADEIIAINNHMHDEGPKADTSLEKLSHLKPVFVPDGSVTAGNSSSLNDGAAVTVIASHQFAKQHDLKPKARILGFASVGVDPKIMGIGPVPATIKLLNKCGLSLNDFHAIEINEAFSAQTLAVIRELKLDINKVNPHGGAIALGHPLGCSGARVITTLINHMVKSQQPLGLASLCVGVGQGVTMALEAV
jgi:acetyl-CoA acetyltransferase family protein